MAGTLETFKDNKGEYRSQLKRTAHPGVSRVGGSLLSGSALLT